MKNFLKAIVFDFDGTLVDSNPIKRAAYFYAFASYASSVRPIVEEAVARLEPCPRAVLIQDVVVRLAEMKAIDPESAPELQAASLMRYQEYCEKRTVTCPEIKGAGDALRELARRYPLYLNSSTPFDPLRLVVERRRMTCYFKKIFGVETGKESALKEIIRSENAKPDEIVFVGDGIVDLESAEICGTQFIGIDSQGGKLRDKKPPYLLSDCTALVETIEEVERVARLASDTAVGGKG